MLPREKKKKKKKKKEKRCFKDLNEELTKFGYFFN